MESQNANLSKESKKEGATLGILFVLQACYTGTGEGRDGSIPAKYIGKALLLAL